MRKFVNKKRQKRKYTKKSEAASSYSSAKTAYGMIPLIIMFIAFMSTLVISAPLRDSLENIKFTFELPQFSLSNPLTFFQTAWVDITQVGMVIGIIGQMAGVTIAQNAIGITQKIQYGIIFMSNFLILSGDEIIYGFLSVFKEFLFGLQVIDQGITFVIKQIDLATNFCLQTIATATISAGQFIARVTIAITNTTIQFLLLLIHYIAAAAITIGHFVAIVVLAIWKTLVSTGDAIGNFFAKVFTAIAHIIEIPFKTLHAFWLLIKPYVDIFGNHVKMSGGDFSNMFTSLGKISSMVGATK